MTLAVKTGDVRDVDAIMPIMRAAFDSRFGEAWSAEQCRGVLTMPGTTLSLAMHGEVIIGFALWRSILDEAELFLIAVDPSVQSKGSGAYLLSHVIDHARQKGVASLHVEVRSDNPARRLYASQGFVEVGSRANYYRRSDNGPNDAITLRLSLDEGQAS